MRLTARDEHIDLLPDRAAYWHRRKTLFVADLHLGKPAAFRAAGIPVPDSCPADLARLSTLISTHAPERLVILGDFFHARAGRAPYLLDLIHTWRSAHSQLDILLIRGNHDTHAGDPPPFFNFRIHDEPHADSADHPLRFAHVPPSPRPHMLNSHVSSEHAEHSHSPLTICGHIHPAIRLTGPVHSLRADCFLLTPTTFILPAFGSFTGSKVISPSSLDRVFVIGDDSVIELPQRRHAPSRTPAAR